MASCSKTITILALIAATAQLTWASSNAQADETTDPYLQDATSYQLTENEYADLRAYMSQAKETLEKTLADARQLSGYRLHKRLVLGVTDALSQSGIRHELLLFRYILKRALEIDQISQRPGMGSQEQALIGTSVLLRQIRIAILYYNNIDLPRVGNGLQIPAPDWTKFAFDQIPALLRIIDEAPDETAKFEITKRALGWTAKALNTSTSRRNYSKEIVSFTETLRYLNQGINSVDQAKDTLKKLLPTDDQSTSRPFPAANYPATDPVKPGPFFPIFPGTVGTDGSLWTDERDQEHHGVQIQIGLGPIMEKESGEATAGFAAVSARAQLWYRIETRDHDPFFAVADVRGQVTTGAQPLYHIKATGLADFFILGVWIAFEASDYQRLSDRILRLGWGNGYTFNTGGKNYVMVRGGVGTSLAHIEVRDQKVIGFGGNAHSQGISLEAATIIKAGRFLINFEAGYDYMPHSDQWIAPTVHRFNTAASVGYMLNAIFRGDRITVEGEFIDTMVNDENYTVTTLGVNYGFMF